MKKVEHEVVVDLPAEEVWRVWIKNFQVTLPAAVPQHYSSVEYLDGPPLAVGGYFRINYAPTFPHFQHMKAVWEEMDHANHSATCRSVEGGHLGHHPVHVTYSVKLLAGPRPSSCITKWTFHYDEAAKGEIHEFLIEEMSIFGTHLQSHVAACKPKSASK